MAILHLTEIAIIQRRKCSLMKKEETPYIVPKYPHFLAVWTKLETFYFQIFCLKKRKSADQRKTFISVYTPFSVCLLLFWTQVGSIINWQEAFHKLLEKKQCLKYIVRLKHLEQGLYTPTTTPVLQPSSLTLLSSDVQYMVDVLLQTCLGAF
jgi:hypothetical protein